MSLQWTLKDIQIAERFRLARLTASLPVLSAMVLHFDLEEVLNIHCAHDGHAACVLFILEELQFNAYVILGCRTIQVWQNQQKIGQYKLDSESTLATLDEIMVTTLEPQMSAVADATEAIDLASSTSAPASISSLPGQSLNAIAADVEQDPATIRAWIIERGWSIIPFGGDEIISGDTAIAAFDYFGQLLLNTRKAKRGLGAGNYAMPAAPAEPASSDGSVPEATATPTKSRALALPAKFDSKIVKNSRTTLERALPVKPEARQQYLEAISSGGEAGQVFLEKVAAAMVKKLGGDKDKTLGSLRSAAKKLQAEPQVG